MWQNNRTRTGKRRGVVELSRASWSKFERSSYFPGNNPFHRQTERRLSHLVLNLSKLGHQFLELGYSGKAGLSLAKAQNLLSSGPVATDVKLQWHLAYAEYLLKIGNSEKW